MEFCIKKVRAEDFVVECAVSYGSNELQILY